MLATSIFAALLLSASATAGPIKRSPRLHKFGGFQMGSDPWGSVVVSCDPSGASDAIPSSTDTSASTTTTTSIATTIKSSSAATMTTTSASNPTTASAEPAATSSDVDRSSVPDHQDFQGNGNWVGNNDWSFSTSYSFSTSFSSSTDVVSQDIPAASETTISSTDSQTYAQSSASTFVTSSSSASSSPSSASAPAPSQSQSGNSGVTAQDDIDAYLKVHNTARAAHKAQDLQWNNSLAEAASSWVGNCNFEHSGGSLGPYGENLAEGTNTDASAAVQMWVDEGSSFNANSPEDYASLHFTQVVWAATTQLGCANKSCGGMVMHVCEYFPQGNVLGTFGDNVN